MKDEVLPGNRIENVRRRVNRARNFPTNTCPASRHVHLVAEQLLSDKDYWLTHPIDRKHLAGSMLSVLESLWKARTKLAKHGIKR
jgi:hypothetical protein